MSCWSRACDGQRVRYSLCVCAVVRMMPARAMSVCTRTSAISRDSACSVERRWGHRVHGNIASGRNVLGLGLGLAWHASTCTYAHAHIHTNACPPSPSIATHITHHTYTTSLSRALALSCHVSLLDTRAVQGQPSQVPLQPARQEEVTAGSAEQEGRTHCAPPCCGRCASCCPMPDV